MRIRIAAALVTVIALAAPAKGAEPNWERIAINMVLWGQLTGCLMRFQEYSRYVDEKVSDKQIDGALRVYVGDIEGLLNKLFEANRRVQESPQRPEVYRKLIESVAEREVNRGVAWLQTLGCVAGLRENVLIE